jgi:hypothetical protein
MCDLPSAFVSLGVNSDRRSATPSGSDYLECARVMSNLQLQIQTLVPNEPWWPDEQALGERLARLVKTALEGGGAPTVAVSVRRERVEIVPLGPIIEAKRHPGRFLCALTRWDSAELGEQECTGIIGRMRMRRSDGDAWVPLAMVFLEWPDGRWWQWKALLDAEGKLLADTETINRAIDGLARPAGLGGWWSIGRRENLVLNLERAEERAELPTESKLIH